MIDKNHSASTQVIANNLPHIQMLDYFQELSLISEES
jgi:hypothetical protein